jgi:hypothetical protein
MTAIEMKFHRTCRCGKEFMTTKTKQVYCSAKCRYKAYRDSRVEISVEQWKEYLALKELAASVGLVGW